MVHAPVWPQSWWTPMYYRNKFGYRARSGWGAGSLLSDYAEGDIVEIAADAPAFVDGRIPHTWSSHPEQCQRPGRYRVVAAFSTGEGPEWYYRVCPMELRDGRWRTFWDNPSDRLHVVPGRDFTEGWTLIQSADPGHVDTVRRRREALAVAARSFTGTDY